MSPSREFAVRAGWLGRGFHDNGAVGVGRLAAPRGWRLFTMTGQPARAAASGASSEPLTRCKTLDASPTAWRNFPREQPRNCVGLTRAVAYA
jgi:hypothetical protein